MACGPFQILEISDGTTTVSLLSPRSGFCLSEWEPALAEPKGGGVWRDSQLAEGRRLAMRERANTIDTLTLSVRNWTADDLIRDTQELRRLLEKAYAYDTTTWQGEPVWIKRHPVGATNAEYSIIHDYRTPRDGNPHGSGTFWTALGRASFPVFVLILEHDPWWTANQPGVGAATEASALEAYDGRNLGNVDSTGARQATTADAVFAANRRTEANITDIQFWNGAAWNGANLMDAALPYAFLPAAPAAGDVVVFGIDTVLADSGPFASLVFDLLAVQNDLTIVWRYSQGGADPTAWPALGVQDNTNAAGAMTGQAFDTAGVNSVHWRQPSNWATFNPQVGAGPALGVTGYWVAAHVTAVGGAPAAPTQQNRDIYSVVWPYVEVQSSAVGGDIPAEMQLRWHARSGRATIPQLQNGRFIMGLRSVDRGADFAAYINLADEQRPPNINVNLYTGWVAHTTKLTAPCGRCIRYSPPGAIPGVSSEFELDFINGVETQYYGTYHAFIRYQQNGGAAGDHGVQLAVTYSGVVAQRTPIVRTGDLNDHQLLDMGRLTLGPTGVLSPSERFIDSAFYIEFFLGSTNATPTLDLYDLILIPTDEFAWEAIVSQTSPVYYNYYLDADGITNPKNRVRSIVRRMADDYVVTIWQTIGGDAFLQANARQRLWFLTGRHISGNNYPYDPGAAASVRILRNQRYLSMRGAR